MKEKAMMHGLKDLVELHWNGLGLYLDIKKRWSGWGGDMLENHTIDLTDGTIDEKQKLLDDYLKEHDLEEVVKIPLMELIEKKEYDQRSI